MSDVLAEAAKLLGFEHGRQRGECVFNSNNCTHVAAMRIINGYTDGEEEVMDLCPSPLSGEWADDPTPCTAIDEIANLAEAYHLVQGQDDIEEALKDSGNILDVYEEAFKAGFWAAVILSANSIIVGQVS
jgi:hypothetical protein